MIENNAADLMAKSITSNDTNASLKARLNGTQSHAKMLVGIYSSQIAIENLEINR